MQTLLMFLTVVFLSFILLLFFKHKKNTLLTGLFAFVFALLFGVSIFLYGFSNSDSLKDAITGITHTDAANQQKVPDRIVQVKDAVLLDTPPVIDQFPELPRGCEVTSLAMLLQSAGVDVDKMTLADKIKRDPAPKKIIDGQTYFGNPSKGFVGNMYTFDEPGHGVYHEPILELAEDYLPGQTINLSGQTFDELKIHLSDGRPVWVIINTQYRELEDSYFQTWLTEDGPIRITMKEHSVLITGYDENYVYFNDPLTVEKNKKTPIADFEKSWVQMGSHAITYLLQ